MRTSDRNRAGCRAISRTATSLFLTLAILLPACVPGNRVSPSERAVQMQPAALQWRPLVATDLLGLYESEQAGGDVAAQIWKAYYHFAGDGSFSAAALLFRDPNPVFQVLQGQWRIDGTRLGLGDTEPSEASACEDRLRLVNSSGNLVLRRVELR